MNLFTAAHVLISLVAIISGFVVVAGLIGGRRSAQTALFLTTTAATSVTGFLFPFHHFMPSHGVGLISLAVLVVALYALYARGLAGIWRRTYVLTAVAVLYLNVFVLVVQAFLKVPALKALAPTQSEPPFKVAPVAVLALFIALAAAAAIRFKGPAGDPGSPGGG